MAKSVTDICAPYPAPTEDGVTLRRPPAGSGCTHGCPHPDDRRNRSSRPCRRRGRGDSAGHADSLRPGDDPWMTAGRGVMHSRIPRASILREGGRAHGFRIRANLPAYLKMTQPRYQEPAGSGIPEATSQDGLARVRIIAGEAPEPAVPAVNAGCTAGRCPAHRSGRTACPVRDEQRGGSPRRIDTAVPSRGRCCPRPRDVRRKGYPFAIHIQMQTAGAFANTCLGCPSGHMSSWYPDAGPGTGCIPGVEKAGYS